MSDDVWQIMAWCLGMATTAVIVDRGGLWLVTRVVSLRALTAHAARAGGCNRMVLHGLNTADNCRTPMSVADAMICYCVYDVSKMPLRITPGVPAGYYWSLSCYGVDTTNFYSINDQQIPQGGNGGVSIVLRDAWSSDRPCSVGGTTTGDATIVVRAPSRRGVVLIRVLVNDPADLTEQTQLTEFLRRTRIEPLPVPHIGNDQT